MKYSKYKLRLITRKLLTKNNDLFHTVTCLFYINTNHKEHSRKPVIRFRVLENDSLKALQDLSKVINKTMPITLAILHINHRDEDVKYIARRIMNEP